MELWALSFLVIVSAVAWFAGGKDLSGSSREIIRQMFNFELTILIVSLVLGFIPLVGLIAGFAIMIANIVFAIKSFAASNNNAEFKAPCYEFIK